MKIIIIILFITCTQLSWSQNKESRFELGIGYANFIPAFKQSYPIFGDDSKLGLNCSFAISFYKHLNIKYDFSIIEIKHHSIYDTKGEPTNPSGESLENQYFTNYNGSDKFINNKISFYYSANLNSGIKFKFGMGVGLNGSYLFNKLDPFNNSFNRTVKTEETEIYEAELNLHIPSTIINSLFIAPTLIISKKITRFLSFDMSIDFRHYFKEQPTYIITNLIIDDKYDVQTEVESYHLLQFQYKQFPMYKMHYTIGLSLNFGKI